MIGNEPNPKSRPRWKLRFFAVWGSQSLSSFGSALVWFALIWWLTKTTGKATTLAVATIVTFLPPIVIGPFAGVFVDRYAGSRCLSLPMAPSR